MVSAEDTGVFFFSKYFGALSQMICHEFRVRVEVLNKMKSVIRVKCNIYLLMSVTKINYVFTRSHSDLFTSPTVGQAEGPR